MAIDSIRALVGSAIEEAIAGGPCPHFELLEPADHDRLATGLRELERKGSP